MTIFAVLMPIPQPQIVAAIKDGYPENYYSINETQWLISSSNTVIEVTAKLGIVDANNPQKPPTGNAVVFAVSSYYGRAPSLVWDWIKSKLEASSNG